MEQRERATVSRRGNAKPFRLFTRDPGRGARSREKEVDASWVTTVENRRVAKISHANLIVRRALSGKTRVTRHVPLTDLYAPVSKLAATIHRGAQS